MKWLGRYLKQMIGNVKTAISNMRRKVFSTGMTDADIEASEKTLENQQILNEQEYQRKIDFYEMYESPQAQVRQMKSAGLNPALMYSSAPSVSASGGIGSAGSAPASVSSDPGMLSTLLNMVFNMKQLDMQNAWKQREMDIQEDLGNKEIAVKTDWNEMNRPHLAAETTQLIELTRGSKLDNDLKDKILPVLEQQAQAELDFKLQQTVESRKRVDDLGSQIEMRRHQNKHFDAQVTQLYSLVRQQNYYTDVYLPQMLANDTTLTLAQHDELEQRANESIERQKQIKELTKKTAIEAGIKAKDFVNWVWLNSRPIPWNTQIYGETEYEAPPVPEDYERSKTRKK